MDSIYDLAEVNNYLDFMHIMAYDFHGSWDDVIGANAPLYGLNEDDTSSVVRKNKRKYSIFSYMINYNIIHTVRPVVVQGYKRTTVSATRLLLEEMIYK